MNFEKELSAALDRTSPPEGFSDRVLARVREETSSGNSGRAAYAGGWTRIAAGLLLVVSTGLLSSQYLNDIRHEMAGQRAKQELMLAMKIASQKTNLARQEVLSSHSAPTTTQEGEDQ